MSAMKTIKTLTLAFALGLASYAHAAPPVEVAVEGPRVHLAELVADATDVDLGPVPSAGGSRIVGRAEILAALKDAGAPPPKKLPDAIRVVRKMAQLAAPEIERAVRDALAAKMPRGATLAAVQAPRTLSVPQGWTRTVTELPHPPRRSGAFNTTATVSFYRDDEVLARALVPVELSLSSAAATYDVMRGGSVTLVIRRGLVEVTVAASAGADADIGGTLPITLRPSGRVVSARLIDKDHAVSLEGS